MFLVQLVQVLYWLGLSAWFGSVFFISISWQAIINSVKENDPTLPEVLAVNLEGQHATLLSGSIVGSLLALLVKIELVCGLMLFVTIVAQWFLLNLQNSWNLTSAFMRSAMYLAAVGLVIYDWRIVWPRIQQFRKQFIAQADEPDTANPILDQLNRYQRESMTLLTVLFFLLLGIVALSGNMDFILTVAPTSVGK